MSLLVPLREMRKVYGTQLRAGTALLLSLSLSGHVLLTSDRIVRKVYLPGFFKETPPIVIHVALFPHSCMERERERELIMRL